jgi:hypothetical protein
VRNIQCKENQKVTCHFNGVSSFTFLSDGSKRSELMKAFEFFLLSIVFIVAFSGILQVIPNFSSALLVEAMFVLCSHLHFYGFETSPGVIPGLS